MALSMQSCLIVKFVAELTYFVGHDRNLPGVLRVGFCDVSVTTSGQAEHADSLLGNKSSCGTGRSLHATKRKTHERARLQDESGARGSSCSLAGKGAQKRVRQRTRVIHRQCERETKNVPGLPQFTGKALSVNLLAQCSARTSTLTDKKAMESRSCVRAGGG